MVAKFLKKVINVLKKSYDIMLMASKSDKEFTGVVK